MRPRRLVVLATTVVLVSACGRQTDQNPVSTARPDVLLFTIDTLRADRLGVGITPTLDRLAATGARFTAARATAPLTLPSHATILTGLLPPIHGVRENGGRLAESHARLPGIFRAAGYRTAAFIGAFVLDRRFGLDGGFDTYDDRIPRDPDAAERLEAERPASAVVDAALAWFETVAPSRGLVGPPFFVWIHLYDPHAPYSPPATNPLGGYDGEIAYADSQIARVLDWLRTHALADRTVIVAAGDHGEALGEHGEQTHGMLLYDSTLRVPLVVAVPARAPEVRHEAVSLADVAPTILRAAGLAPPDAMKGNNLLATDAKPKGDVYSETEYPRVAGWSPLQALTDGRWKAIRAGPSTEVYDLRNDPGELRDLAASQPSLASAMTARLDTIRPTASRTERLVLPEVQERLRALGYVSGSAMAAASPTRRNPSKEVGTWTAFERALSALDKRPSDTLPVLKRLSNDQPDAMVFRSTYARALKEAGQAAAAVGVYRAAVKRWPADAVLLHDLAVAAREAATTSHAREARRLRDEAARAEQAAIALTPDSASAHNGLGLLAIDADRPGEALVAFGRATALDPGNASYWANLGNARRATRDRAGAEQAYRRALDADSRAADAANGLGVLLVEAKRPVEAVPWFERAIAVAPEFVEAKLNLGIALQQSGDVSRAARTYREVLRSSPRHARERDAAAKLLAAVEKSR